MESTLTRQSSARPQPDAEKVNHAGLTTYEEIGSRLVLALESAYNAIRLDHPEVPEAVIVISSSPTRYGHYARSRWSVDDRALPEIMVSAEGLKRPPRHVLGTIVHEAAHGLAHSRNIEDTSNRNRFHNKRFKQLAEELGLVVHKADKILGHTNTELPEGEHNDILVELTSKLVAWREFDIPQPHATDSRTRELTLRCDCRNPRDAVLAARTIRAFPSIFDQGPILCGVCGGEFYEK